MQDTTKPRFITFEGGEGSGKSTQSKMLHNYLLSKNIKSRYTREIGGTIEAEKIRDILVFSELMPMSELMLVMAARYEHINKVIIPALQLGSWVICDRFIDSTASYQSDSHEVRLENIYDLHKKLMTNAIMPDLTFFMNLSPEIGIKRANRRGNTNKFEEKEFIFHKKIYDKFKLILSNNQDRIVSIDCLDKDPGEIHQDIIARLNF